MSRAIGLLCLAMLPLFACGDNGAGHGASPDAGLPAPPPDAPPGTPPPDAPATPDAPPPDTTAPDTTLTQAPAALTATADASFAFTASDADAHFECALDAAAFTACTSPLTLTVGDGSHTFAVRALDAAGNADLTPAQASWLVDTTPTTCGDGAAHGTEVCDGDDVRGASCTSLGHAPGTIKCKADCSGFDANACDGGFLPASHGFTGTPCFDGLRYSAAKFTLPYVLACTEDQGVFKTDLDADTTWTNTTNAAGVNPHGRAIAINPNGPPVYYLSDGSATNNGYRSNTHGDTWTAQSIVDGTTPREMYTFAFRQGIGNIAGSWSASEGAIVLHGNTPGLVPHFVGATPGSVTGTVRGVANGGSNDVYVAVYGQTPAGDPATGGIFWACDLSMTGGGTYSERDHGLSDADRKLVWSLAVDPSTISNATFACGESTHGGMATTYYAALRGGGQIYKTIDGGANWTQRNAGIAPGAEVYSIAVDCFAPPVAPQVVPTDVCQNPNLVYAATSNGLYQSTDAGAHWALAGFEGKQVRALTVDPMPASNPPHVFVGVNDPAGGTTGIYQSPPPAAPIRAAAH